MTYIEIIALYKCNQRSSGFTELSQKKNSTYLHAPKKDLNDICFAYDHLTPKEKSLKEEDYNVHIKRKTLSRSKKDSIKDKALRNYDDDVLVEFDLEALRYCPKIHTQKFFYKRRLAVYNLTVFYVAFKDANCYLWHESQTNRNIK